ncbi:MAG: tRNA (uridine(54)-C5)-methyltransferase TrmA [Pseudomonadota bacterium]
MTVFALTHASDQIDFAHKLSRFRDQLTAVGVSEAVTQHVDTFTSPATQYRMRAEFRIWHDGDTCAYAMHDPRDKRVYTIEEFAPASRRINDAMPRLIERINQTPELKKRLFQVEFLSTLTNELLISLIYHRQLDEQWDVLATALGNELDCFIIGRARKQRRVLHQDFVTESLTIHGDTYRYQQVENSFTQPNALICEKMIEWAVTHTRDSQAHDLLELYCGNGNFTLPLAQNFRRVLATEISKVSVRSAHYNLALNHIDNVVIARLSSEEFVEAHTKVRPFRRLKDIDLEAYRFDTVFVDPPRSGLDARTLRLVSQFDRIVYISCNPQTLVENLRDLQGISRHTVTRAAAFDQFPTTPHLEVGVVLHTPNEH